MARPPRDYAVVDLDAERPVVLRGTPAAVRGVLPLRNPSDRRAVVREVGVTDPTGTLGIPPAGGVRTRTTVLQPQQARAVRVSLALDPRTPPGDYELSLTVGDREQRALVHVVESVAVDVTPNPIVIENRPRETVRKTAVVANNGNVPVTIGEIGAVVLDDELLACRSLRATVAALGDTEDDEGVTIERTLTQLARDFKATFDQASRLRVRNASGTLEVEPGELAKLELEIEVPETLDPRTRFFGRVAIYDTDLQLVVVPCRGAPARERPSAPAPRRRGRRPSRTTSPGDQPD